VDAGVTWGSDGIGLQLGSSTIKQWAKVDITQTGVTFTASVVPCAIEVPDFEFHAEGIIEHEWYGLLFNSSFANVPPATTTGRLNNLSPGATVNLAPTAIQIGVALTNPFDPTWPATFEEMRSLPGVTFPDVDGDGKPGMAVGVKTGPRPVAGQSYSLVPVDLGEPIPRVDKLQIVVRQIASQAGRLDSCTRMSGTANVTAIDNHVMGCSIAGSGADCVDAPNLQIADAARPVYTIGQSTFQAVKLEGATTCTAAKGALP
jgi:hypothetical protein